jgi:hypothetical protein
MGSWISLPIGILLVGITSVSAMLSDLLTV